ncbi:YceI family protein [Gracilimonas amylolytica]|uniref:YceI family protein n=1 Tax=Gracilimonas amylolytica TaxID=1749045 RepID=UPI000CD906B9|nr:YceI family protein [Gracilimonas amylolytica]
MSTWNIDPTHSEIQFKVKHLVISTVTGYFRSFNGTVESEGDSFEGAKITFEADIDSVDTNNEDRDTHLKSDDFFNAEAYPKMKFESTSFKNTGGDNYELTGNMTIRDVTKEITLDVTHGGTVEDPYGQTKAGFELNGSLNRKEFGLKWSAVTEAGSVVVGDEVKLLMNVQVVEAE